MNTAVPGYDRCRCNDHCPGASRPLPRTVLSSSRCRPWADCYLNHDYWLTGFDTVTLNQSTLPTTVLTSEGGVDGEHGGTTREELVQTGALCNHLREYNHCRSIHATVSTLRVLLPYLAGVSLVYGSDSDGSLGRLSDGVNLYDGSLVVAVASQHLQSILNVILWYFVSIASISS